MICDDVDESFFFFPGGEGLHLRPQAVQGVRGEVPRVRLVRLRDGTHAAILRRDVQEQVRALIARI